MNCLVLGGSGFLGSHLSERLVELDHHVRVFEKPGKSAANLDSIADRIELSRGDFDDPQALEAALSDIDVVFHLISTTVPGNSNDDPAFDISSNLLPTLALLDLARRHQVEKIVFFSSGGTVYGVPQEAPMSELHPTNPICSYGIHKLAIEKYLEMYRQLHGLEYCVLRISNAFGERQNPKSGQGAVAAFAHKALHGEEIEIWGDGSVVRDYIYVADIMTAAVKAMHFAGDSKVFNIGSGAGTSLLEMVDAIGRIMGSPVAVRFTPARAFDVPTNVLDIRKARQELGWQPEVEFEVGLERTLNFLRTLDP
jgi:UDP-glucose 4-epimerase